MPFTIITQGQFTSAGVGVKIPLPSSADYFVTENITQLNTTQATGRCVGGRWYRNAFSDNGGIRKKKSNNTNVIEEDLFSTATVSNGFTYVPVVPVTESQAANAITAITAASPAVVSQTNSYNEGDIIRLYNTTGMLQIAGMPFQISSVSGAGYTLIGLRAAGFAAPATAGFTRRLSKYEAVDPQFLYVTEITQATSAVVRCSVDPSNYYSVGMLVRFSVPQSFGMVEINGLTGRITAISSANYTMTVDIDSSAFTAFAFPASSAVPTTTLFATVAPAGQRVLFNPTTGVQTGYDFTLAPFHTGEFSPFMYLAPGVNSPAGSLNDVIVWQACKSETGIIT